MSTVEIFWFVVKIVGCSLLGLALPLFMTIKFYPKGDERRIAILANLFGALLMLFGIVSLALLVIPPQTLQLPYPSLLPFIIAFLIMFILAVGCIIVVSYFYSRKSHSVANDVSESVEINIQDMGQCYVRFDKGVLREIQLSNIGKVNEDFLKMGKPGKVNNARQDITFPVSYVHVTIGNTTLPTMYKTIQVKEILHKITNIYFS